MNLPNTLTIARIFFVPLLVAVLVQERIILHWNGAVITNDVVALIIFWVAAATDLLDGYLARRWGQVTTIGTLLDPIADKLLVSAALIALVQVRVVAGWLVVLLVGREFAVSGLRSIAAVEGYTIKASELGKTKTFWQVLAISLLMLSRHHHSFERWADYSLYIVVLFSVWSAVSYFAKFWRKVDISTKQRRRQELLIAERQRRRLLLEQRREAMRNRRRAARAAKADRAGAGNLSRGTADLPPSA
ncbi:MAG TPA: CDP-diacylglycerol--glycerol-3-phosphate 3-phosphatidyltransferase [Bryobacteraceae bacterium]|jgi:CDP-diacylglycerol--glycerol-3-phosphate 3-phosphatidyltransferase|nr:CDP-diacylglycerol--glycerol-3-phosphate 3-phosphatidyltransferase [Bryobacteraceae bacterium]